ncbi:hypothetical protein D3C71_1403400 [compost metagenome]
MEAGNGPVREENRALVHLRNEPIDLDRSQLRILRQVRQQLFHARRASVQPDSIADALSVIQIDLVFDASISPPLTQIDEVRQQHMRALAPAFVRLFPQSLSTFQQAPRRRWNILRIPQVDREETEVPAGTNQ